MQQEVHEQHGQKLTTEKQLSWLEQAEQDYAQAEAEKARVTAQREKENRESVARRERARMEDWLDSEHLNIPINPAPAVEIGPGVWLRVELRSQRPDVFAYCVGVETRDLHEWNSDDYAPITYYSVVAQADRHTLIEALHELRGRVQIDRARMEHVKATIFATVAAPVVSVAPTTPTIATEKTRLARQLARLAERQTKSEPIALHEDLLLALASYLYDIANRLDEIEAEMDIDGDVDWDGDDD